LLTNAKLGTQKLIGAKTRFHRIGIAIQKSWVELIASRQVARNRIQRANPNFAAFGNQVYGFLP